MAKRERPRFAGARVKRLMQSDEDVGRIAGGVPAVVSKCMEAFAEELVTKAARGIEEEDGTLTVAHIKACVESEQPFASLRGVVDGAATKCDSRPKQRRGAGGGGGRVRKPPSDLPGDAAGAPPEALFDAVAAPQPELLAAAAAPLAELDDEYDE